MILAGCAGGTCLPAALQPRLRRLWFAFKRNGKVVIMVWRFKQFYTLYDSRRLRGWNLFAGGSLATFASILVRLQAKRDGGDYVLASFNKFMLCIFLARYAGGTVLAGALW